MAPVRLSSVVRHRKSSASTLASIANIKAGQSSSVIFAPNVTPITYAEDALAEEGALPELTPEFLADASLFPPGESLLGDLNARRSHGARKKGADYIPRPPNAFMLFRADFVKQRHVPGSIESTHGSLSKIIGTCWRHLPHEEKHVWEIKAKHAKAEHKARYPNYRFRPVHNKVKKVTKPQSSPEEEARCDSVARLLLEGKKGDELTREVRALDDALTQAQAAAAAKRSREIASYQAQEAAARLHAPVASRYAPYPHRRSSSVPPMLSNITIPTVPFLHSDSRPRSPQPASASSFNQQQARVIRRPSSVPPIPPMNWFQTPMQHEPYSAMDSPLPEPDTSMFNQAFFGNSPFGAPQNDNAGFSWAPETPSVAPHHQMNMPPMDMRMHAPPSLDFSFTENGLAPHELPTPASATLPTPGFGQAFDMAQSSSFMAPLAHAPSYMGHESYAMDLNQPMQQEYAFAAQQQQQGQSPASNSPAPSEPELYGQYNPTFYAQAPTELAPHVNIHSSQEILLAPEFNFESGQANQGGVEFAPGLFDGMPPPAPMGGEVYPKFSASEFRLSRFDFTA